MRALVYNGPRDVAVADVADPRIEDPRDVVVQVTTTNICGSDLHMYEGRTNVETGKVLGHENMGVVVETGSAVTSVRVGDRVSLPFNIACGFCRNCESGLTGFCLTANPPGAGAAYGYANMGPYSGGQAEFLRVPYADFNALPLPAGRDAELHYAMLSDIFPTGWHGVVMSGMQPGDTVVVAGAGPVGLMAVHSAMLMGASRVFCIDKEKDRLALAERFGATPIDYAATDPVASILDATGGGADRGVDAVGYQAQGTGDDEQPQVVLDTLVGAVRATGGLGVVGVYNPEDPGAASEPARQGRIPFHFGGLFFKGQSLGTGQCNVKAYNRRLRDLITAGRATPGDIVSHEMSLEQAAEGYDKFDRRLDGWTKVVLHPQPRPVAA